LVVFAGSIGFAITVAFAAMPPLLPGISRELGLSGTQIGILAAALSAGEVIATPPAG
jgi:cyanate permease